MAARAMRPHEPNLGGVESDPTALLECHMARPYASRSQRRDITRSLWSLSRFTGAASYHSVAVGKPLRETERYSREREGGGLARSPEISYRSGKR